jgi:hypothetical protein
MKKFGPEWKGRLIKSDGSVKLLFQAYKFQLRPFKKPIEELRFQAAAGIDVQSHPCYLNFCLQPGNKLLLEAVS